jgi:hypothetical protein
MMHTEVEACNKIVVSMHHRYDESLWMAGSSILIEEPGKLLRSLVISSLRFFQSSEVGTSFLVREALEFFASMKVTEPRLPTIGAMIASSSIFSGNAVDCNMQSSTSILRYSFVASFANSASVACRVPNTWYLGSPGK